MEQLNDLHKSNMAELKKGHETEVSNVKRNEQDALRLARETMATAEQKYERQAKIQVEAQSVTHQAEVRRLRATMRRLRTQQQRRLQALMASVPSQSEGGAGRLGNLALSGLRESTVGAMSRGPAPPAAGFGAQTPVKRAGDGEDDDEDDDDDAEGGKVGKEENDGRRDQRYVARNSEVSGAHTHMLHSRLFVNAQPDNHHEYILSLAQGSGASTRSLQLGRSPWAIWSRVRPRLWDTKKKTRGRTSRKRST